MTFEECWERIMACDASFDGTFYTAVRTTKIYCRPSCRSRKPKRENVTFYRTEDEAVEAGYRPCKRCQPDVRRTPDEQVVERVKEECARRLAEPVTLAELGQAVGLSATYVERVFKRETGLTPRQYHESLRMKRARTLLEEGTATNVEVALELGYRSTSAFYNAFRRVHGGSPKEVCS